MASFLSPPDTREVVLLRLREVCRRTGYSRSEIYRRIARGDFPRAIKLGKRASAWIDSEVSQWIAVRIAARDEASS